MKYLVVKVEHNNYDGEERVPMYATDDWKGNYPKEYYFEVWEILSDGTLKMIKAFDTAMDEGMMITKWEGKERGFAVIQKFSGLTRDDPIPKEARKFLNKYKNEKESKIYNCLPSSGKYIIHVGENRYAYEEYFE